MFFSIACNITSFLYPAYQSYKALSSPYPIVVSIPDSSQTQTRPPTRTEQSFEIERWLTYWVLLGLFSSIESLIGWTISWIPFYTTLKTIFFLALAVSPSSIPVPELLYGKVVKPLFEEHEEAIERGLEALRMKSTGWVVRCGSWVWSRVREGMSVGVRVSFSFPFFCCAILHAISSSMAPSLLVSSFILPPAIIPLFPLGVWGLNGNQPNGWSGREKTKKVIRETGIHTRRPAEECQTDRSSLPSFPLSPPHFTPRSPLHRPNNFHLPVVYLAPLTRTPLNHHPISSPPSFPPTRTPTTTPPQRPPHLLNPQLSKIPLGVFFKVLIRGHQIWRLGGGCIICRSWRVGYRRQQRARREA